MAASIAEVLRRHLPAGAYERLRELTDDWADNPFQYDGETGAFEPTDRWLFVEFEGGEEDVELLMAACDVLTEHRHELDMRHIRLRDPVMQGEEEIVFEFYEGSPDDPQVGEDFLRLLKGSPGFKVTQEELPSGLRVTVHFDYAGESDYFSFKSQLEWFAELARRTRHNRPFRASRNG